MAYFSPTIPTNNAGPAVFFKGLTNWNPPANEPGRHAVFDYEVQTFPPGFLDEAAAYMRSGVPIFIWRVVDRNRDYGDNARLMVNIGKFAPMQTVPFRDVVFDMVKRNAPMTDGEFRATHNRMFPPSGSSFGTFITGLAIMAGIGALQTSFAAGATGTATTAASVAAPATVTPTVAAGSVTDAAIAAGLGGTDAITAAALSAGGSGAATATAASAALTGSSAATLIGGSMPLMNPITGAVAGTTATTTAAAINAAAGIVNTAATAANVAEVTQKLPTPSTNPSAPAGNISSAQTAVDTVAPVLENPAVKAVGATALSIGGAVVTAKLTSGLVPKSKNDGGIARTTGGKITQPQQSNTGIIILGLAAAAALVFSM